MQHMLSLPTSGVKVGAGQSRGENFSFEVFEQGVCILIACIPIQSPKIRYKVDPDLAIIGY